MFLFGLEFYGLGVKGIIDSFGGVGFLWFCGFILVLFVKAKSRT